MGARPYVLLSVAMSLDGFIDDASSTRLLLSNEEDFDRVDEVRAGVDAILVGANTIRRDNPRILVRSAVRRQARVDAGMVANPVKVTCTQTGDLDPQAPFFTTGETAKLVYTSTGSIRKVAERLADVATVLGAGEPFDIHRMLADLSRRGINRLMVEGGGAMHTLFLTSGVVDELHLAIAPFFIGEADAPRFVHSGRFAHGRADPLDLVETRQMDNVVLLRYLAPKS